MKRLPIVLLLGLLWSLLTPLAPAHAVDKDCGDFATQAKAQAFFLDHDPKQDPHNLDADGDLIACESNPCPCSTEQPSDGGNEATTTKRTRAKVVKVIDGDTVRVRLRSGAKPSVRILGIDTPEVYGTVECGGRRASRAMSRMLPVGTRVTLVSDPTQANKDRYGRLLRYVVKRSGLDVGRRQLWLGWGRVFVWQDDPFKRVGGYRKAQRSARAHERGIWSLCA